MGSVAMVRVKPLAGTLYKYIVCLSFQVVRFINVCSRRKLLIGKKSGVIKLEFVLTSVCFH